VNYEEDLKAFWVSLGLAIRQALHKPDMKLPCTQEDFLSAFDTTLWRRKIVLLVDEFSELYRASDVIKNSCLRAFREIRNDSAIYAIHSIICAGTFGILRLTPTDRSISPFNTSDSIQTPYFSIEETRTLFYEFAQDNSIIIDGNIVDDVWAKSNGCVSQLNWFLITAHMSLQPSGHGLPLWTYHLETYCPTARRRLEDSVV
jgi:hypothetical protein